VKRPPPGVDERRRARDAVASGVEQGRRELAALRAERERVETRRRAQAEMMTRSIADARRRQEGTP